MSLSILYSPLILRTGVSYLAWWYRVLRECKPGVYVFYCSWRGVLASKFKYSYYDEVKYKIIIGWWKDCLFYGEAQ